MKPEGRELTAIVVGRQDYGESDRILRLLTPDEGKVSVLARGARRRHAGLDIGVTAVVRLRRGRGDLETLVSGEAIAGHVHLRDGLGRLATAIYACELCGALAREGQPELRLYGLLDMALTLLDANGEDPQPAFLLGLEGKALTFAGIGPVLDRCVVCADPIEVGMGFSIEAGGLLHRRCGSGEPVTQAYAAALEAARRAPLRDLLDASLPEGRRGLLSDAVSAHLGRALPSRIVLDALH